MKAFRWFPVHGVFWRKLLRWGVLTARRAWLEPADVWNTRDVDAFRNGLRRHRRPAGARSPR